MPDPNASKRDFALTAARTSHTQQNNYLQRGQSGRTAPSPIPNTRHRAAASWPSLPHFAQRRPGWRGGGRSHRRPSTTLVSPSRHSALQLQR